MGWVSIFHQADLQEALGIPKGITPIAYLCVGYVSHFHAKPELETAGWLPRLPMEDLVYFDQWGQRDDQQPLIAHLQRDQAAAQRRREALRPDPATRHGARPAQHGHFGCAPCDPGPRRPFF